MSDIPDLDSLAETYEEHGYEVASYPKEPISSAATITFDVVKTNFRSLGDIALAHGCYISAVNPNPNNGEIKFWFSKLDVHTEMVKRETIEKVDGVVTEHEIHEEERIVVEDAGGYRGRHDHPHGKFTVDVENDG